MLMMVQEILVGHMIQCTEVTLLCILWVMSMKITLGEEATTISEILGIIS